MSYQSQNYRIRFKFMPPPLFIYHYDRFILNFLNLHLSDKLYREVGECIPKPIGQVNSRHTFSELFHRPTIDQGYILCQSIEL